MPSGSIAGQPIIPSLTPAEGSWLAAPSATREEPPGKNRAERYGSQRSALGVVIRVRSCGVPAGW
jgi:hypothetical protein